MPEIPSDMDRIRSALMAAVADKGTNLAALSKRIGKNPSYLQQFVKYGKPKRLQEDDRKAIAGVLGISEAILKEESPHGNVGSFPQEVLRTPTEFPTFGHWPKDIPVYGIGVGGADGDFTLNGEVIDYVRRPPGLAHVKDAFALYVAGMSMSPWKEAGDLIFVRRNRPPSIGDYVVIELRPKADGEPKICLIKRLLARDAKRVRLQQYNPPDDKIEIPMAQIAAIYRIVPLEELVSS